MNIISQLLEKKIVPIVIISFLTILTLSTSVMGAAKVAGSFNEDKTQNSQVLGLSTEQKNSEDKNFQDQKTEDADNVAKVNSTGNQANLPKTINAGSANGKIVNSPSQGSAVLGSQVNPSVKSNSNSNACIITIFGKQYDVTSLRSSHPGGDVFVCGTDQSATYQSAHGTSVARLAPYLVTAGSVNNTTNNPVTGTSGSQVATGSQQSGLGLNRPSSNHDDDGDLDDDNDNERGDSDD